MKKNNVMVLGIILTILGVVGFVCGIIFPFIFKNINWLFLIYTLFLIAPGITIIASPEQPTKQDVVNGKAYQEIWIITGNDTIKTYDIVWKQKN